MSTDDEYCDYVAVEECPLCGGFHEYYLKVTRKGVPGIQMPPEYDDECMKHTWETTFHCPVKDEDFKLLVDIEHRLYERIDDVDTRLRVD
ncbi:MAG: hypothetical protein JXR72_04370 [Proteobacteria bacterium]|nr:hypothetical protein [Pseudomonadota bacterium]